MKKFLLKTAWVLLTFILLLSIYLVIERLRGKRMLASYRRELLSQGEKLDLEELDLPKLPKEKNGITQFLQAADEIMAMEKDLPISLDGVPMMRPSSPGYACPLIHKGSIPDMNNSNKTWDALHKETLKLSPGIEKLKKALQYPYVQMDLNYSEGFGAYPHFGKIRGMARGLSSISMCQLHEGKIDEAIATLETLAKLDRTLKDEPLIISQLVRTAEIRITLSSIWEILQVPHLTESQLIKLQQVTSFPSVLDSLAESFEVERAMDSPQVNIYRKSCAKYLDYIRGVREMYDDGYFQNPPWGMGSDSIMSLRWWLWRIAWSDQEEARDLKTWQRRINVLRIVQHQKALNAGTGLWGDEPEKLNAYDRFRFIMSAEGIFGPSGCTRSICQSETLKNMTATAVALRYFQLKNRNLPENLEILSPKFLSVQPVDYMDGKSLKYHKLSKTDYLLYSIGENGKDDGGDPTAMENDMGKGMWHAKDAVWPKAADVLF